MKAAGVYVFAGGLEEEDGPVYSADATSGTLVGNRQVVGARRTWPTRYRVVDTDDPGWREYREDVESSDELHRGEWLWVEEGSPSCWTPMMVARSSFRGA